MASMAFVIVHSTASIRTIMFLWWTRR